MFGSNRILALNVGAGKLVLAEFSVRSGHSPVLLNYGIGDLGQLPDNESASSAFLIAELKDLLSATGNRTLPLLMAVSGQVVFPRFIKLPPVAKDKLLQMIQYEAEQNVPFPIDDLVWDYQLIGDALEGEQNAMIVAAKSESVAEIAAAVMETGLEPEVIDVAPMALYNCVRYNYPDLDGCALLVDIGARSTNLVFMEDGKFFSRCIPVAGNAITQDIAKSFQIDFKTAEAMKIECAFVALGGVFAAVGDERADRVSKIVRNVITRLHAEISRSINFYRSQQAGSVPTRVFLTGGSSVIPHMDTFFADKLHAKVEYLNPFQQVALDTKLDIERVGRDAFVLGEVVGLALRRGLACPLEINLLPEEIGRRKVFRRRMPYFGIAAAGLIVTAGIWTVYTRQTLKLYERQAQQVDDKLQILHRDKQAVTLAQKSFKTALNEAEEKRIQIARRTHQVRVFDALRECLYPGMWLTAVERVVGDAQGGVARVRISGCGWVDRLKELEEASEVKATAVELFRDQLRLRPVFASEGVTIKREHEDAEGALRRFEIEAAVAPIS